MVLWAGAMVLFELSRFVALAGGKALFPVGSAAAGSPFSFSCRDRFRTSSILAAHLLPLGVSRSAGLIDGKEAARAGGARGGARPI